MRLFYTLIFSLFITCNFLSSQSIHAEKVAEKLLSKMEAEPQGFHSINILLADQVDLAALDAELTSNRASANERSQRVITALKDKAQDSQDRTLLFLKNSPYVQAQTVRSFWIANALTASATKEAIAELSQNPEIEWLGLNGQLEAEEYKEVLPPPGMVPNGIEPGLEAIDAPALWAMGYTGYGQLSMTADTGVDPSHPSLDTRFRGHYFGADESWYEFAGQNTVPYDCDGHGTHVTGTILGLDRNNHDTTGVAFNAHWIGGAVICGIGTADNIASFQWSLDPDNNPATSEDIPDAINNSWRDPSLGNDDCMSVYVPILEAMEAIGIAVIFSAGNEGPGDMTITPPHNINISEVNLFSVGALNGNVANYPIAGFSSRGPSHCGGDSSLLIKPEVSAPGVNVRSSTPGNNFSFFDGTSMASPHVCGAILLLKEAFPDLTGKELKTALYHSCTDLGAPGEDNIFGMGIINVLNAFNYLVDLGHVPVSPHRANDVLIVEVLLKELHCENEISAYVQVENGGTDTLYSFDVYYEAGAFNNTFGWSGVLAPRERAAINLPGLTADEGDYTLRIELQNPNGVPDEKPLNSQYRVPVSVLDRPAFEAIVEGFDGTACENSSALLRGVLPDNLLAAGGFMDIDWYDQPAGGIPVGQGEAFITPVLTEFTTYFADVTYKVPVGPKNHYFADNELLDTTDLGLRFKVDNDCTLEAVHVFLEQTGAVKIDLWNIFNEIIKQDISIIAQTGKVKLNLNWELTQGIYKIVISGGKPLSYNTEGAEYPYEVEDLISITGPSHNQSNDEAYYFFYDWVVSYKEPCGRSAVQIEVTDPGTPPEASFTPSFTEVNVDDNEVIDFNNTSNGAVDWHWNFGDGTTSTDESPNHTYTLPGTYTVSLTAQNADGCTGSAIASIEVKESTISTVPVPPSFENIAVFPNPVSDMLRVFLDLPSSKNVSLRIADTTGKVWKTENYASVQAQEIQLEVSALPIGVYFLLLQLGNNNSVWKVVKL